MDWTLDLDLDTGPDLELDKKFFIFFLLFHKNIFSLLRRIMCNDGIATDFEFDREVAYSREPNQPKQYVQNLLTRDAARIYELWVRYVQM